MKMTPITYPPDSRENHKVIATTEAEREAAWLRAKEHFAKVGGKTDRQMVSELTDGEGRLLAFWSPPAEWQGPGYRAAIKENYGSTSSTSRR